MRFFFILSLLILLLAALAAGLFWKFKPEIPFARTLVSNDGTPLSCEVIGKRGNTLTIQKDSNGQRYDIVTSRLSLQDRLLFMIVKDKAAPQPRKKKVSDPYITKREDEIDQLKKKIEILKIQINSKTLDPIVVRTRNEQVRTMEKEIRVLETSIKTYKLQKKL